MQKEINAAQIIFLFEIPSKCDSLCKKLVYISFFFPIKNSTAFALVTPYF